MVKDTLEDTTSWIMEVQIITTLFDKLLVFPNATMSKTVTLCIQYMTMVKICLQFLEAEQTGDWQLHFDISHMMLP